MHAIECVALQRWPRNFLYFLYGQRANDRSSGFFGLSVGRILRTITGDRAFKAEL